MKILALDTASSLASLALLDGDEVRARTLAGPQSSHSGRILAELDALLADAGCALTQLDAIAFGRGPGAFTGVRLACAVAQGLAMAREIGLVPLDSLAGIAAAAARRSGREEALVLVATDARMQEVYAAGYHVSLAPEAQAQRQGEVRCAPPAEMAAPQAQDWLAAGSAFAVYENELAALRARAAQCFAELDGCADELARLAVNAVRDGRLCAPQDAAPLYVRDKVALTTAERLAAGGRA
ncbi:MAG: tRNA (adenosine(37)-N6)-threonylcarbamoyltransferase complex dimerization subunit type 1 TsaB [Rhodocyclaceae bacterium]|nr:tRNA (adenosine(37)-N6)-threonylcarbamoyltransferase complex dimerization subunit type 1 TsaB [Rhodocyclaceae bacterium]